MGWKDPSKTLPPEGEVVLVRRTDHEGDTDYTVGACFFIMRCPMWEFAEFDPDGEKSKEWDIDGWKRIKQ